MRTKVPDLALRRSLRDLVTTRVARELERPAVNRGFNVRVGPSSVRDLVSGSGNGNRQVVALPQVPPFPPPANSGNGNGPAVAP